MKLRNAQPRRRQSGVILLVVLGALTFFSILVATYLVFSSQSRDASFAIAQRSTRAPDVNWLMNEALMTMVRGTSDPSNPFYGEDLLSDYYGHDGIDMRVMHLSTVPPGPMHMGNGFVRIPVTNTLNVRPPGVEPVDDAFTGSLITFTQGPLRNQTYRVLRSIFQPQQAAFPPNPQIPAHDNLYIELQQGILPQLAANAPPLQNPSVFRLFYADPTDLTTGGFAFHINGAPRNSRGLGYVAGSGGTPGNVSATANPTRNMTMPPTQFDLRRWQQPINPNFPLRTPANLGAGFDLPIALQPNHLGRNVDKSWIPGDYDEGYDAPDFNNWFLSHVRSDGTVIPSFHRPAVLNYILNEVPDWSSASLNDYQNLMVSFSRGTYRPIPLAMHQIANNSSPFNARFTGGSNVFALRSALDVRNRPSLLDQLTRGLISGPWDVDNDADGIADSIWVDLGLPTLTSREGKLLRPLIAPMISDLGGRLNLNAHGNPQLGTVVAGLNTPNANWAGTRDAFGNAANNRRVYRGLGWGPSEIMLPAVSSTSGAITNTTIQNNLTQLLNDRYRFGEQALATPDLPGANDRDILDGVRFGYRPPRHLFNSGFGTSTDPFGRGGVAMGRSGHILAANSGTVISVDNPATTAVIEPTINEAVNNPYELDPTGDLNGDHKFTIADLETILESNEFGSELLPSTLRDRLQLLVNTVPEYARVFTTISTSDDRPVMVTPREPPTDPVTSTQPPPNWRPQTNYALGQIVTVPNGRYLRCINAGTSKPFPGPGFALNPPTGPGVDGTVRWEAFFPETPHVTFLDLLRRIATTPPSNRAQWVTFVNSLVAPEIRLGRKLDINRPFGNRVDDNGNGVIDEPLETARLDNDMNDNDGDGTSDEAGETSELHAHGLHPNSGLTGLPAPFAPPAGPLRPSFPNYTPNVPAAPAGDIPVGARQVLARHLYVLAMALSRDLDMPATENEFPSVSASPPPSWDPTLYKARRLAQWAVNVVDYRDPDSSMTRFVFDPTPFDTTGWSPPADSFATPAPSTSVVWGVEEPQLLFSESLAYHDVRLRDSNRDDDMQTTKSDTPTPDEDSDQVRMPQGSLFLELYCPHATVTTADQTTKPSTPQGLYSNNGSLHLARTAPVGAPRGAPVWRIAISSRHDPAIQGSNPAVQREEPQNFRDSHPDSASFELTVPDELDPAAGTLQYDRFVWFRNVGDVANMPNPAFTEINNIITANGINDMLARQVFVAPFVSNANMVLQPGQYLVLAPRTETRLGSREFGGMYPGIPTDHRFEIFVNEGVIQARHDDTRLTPNLTGGNAPFAPAFPLVIGAPRPSGWAIPAGGNPNLVNNVVGLNVSEPLPRGGNYYPQPTYRFNGNQDVDGDGNEDYLLTDGYVDWSQPNDPVNNPGAFDEPLDKNLLRIPFVGGLEPFLGTIPRYCSAYLQRLADPTSAYNAVTNPYRTVDWIPIDLSVFSGEDRADNISSDNGYAQRSRQRNGDVKTSTGPVPANALFSYETDFDEGGSASLDTGSDEYFQFAGGTGTFAQSSLSFLNTDTSMLGGRNVNPGFPGFDSSIGMLGSPGADNVTGNDRNLPQIPFAVHPWLNRPFASHLELMMVPACSQARLFEEFSFDSAADPVIYPDSGMPDDPAVVTAPFRHLLNFFHSDTGSGTSPELSRLFDFVHTLPRFRGEADAINPLRLISANAAREAQLTAIRSLLAPPFAFDYDNRRQATVNLNTVAEFPVYAGLMQGHLNPLEFTNPNGTTSPPPAMPTQLSFDNFVQSRRGYTVPGAPPFTATPITGGAGPYNYDPAHLSPMFPTEFAGVFRSSTETPKAIALPGRSSADAMRRRSVHGTLLRGAGTLATNESTSGITSLFVRDATQAPVPTSNPHQDRFRNAFMRFQTLMRMPNLASDNSQVFLVQFTLGFFEVDAQTLNLKNEYNADIGQNKRYKASFVVDRSIPVGFIPGQDLNARDVVIFESYDQ